MLLGPSGSGKSTLLRLIAGLERLDGGTIRIGDDLVAGDGVWVSPERRHVGMVFQDWALFPHLTVGANIAFGIPRAERSPARLAEALGLVGLDGMGDRPPHTLSGGQQQRVALARARTAPRRVAARRAVLEPRRLAAAATANGGSRTARSRSV